MTPHFTLAEFTRSDTARRHRVDNTLPADLMPNALQTLQMLERIRAYLSQQAGGEVPIIITSGYRSPAVNALVGSGKTSDHLQACAVDWRAPSFGTAFEVARALAPQVGALGIGQLIHEYGDWVHTSTRMPTKMVNRIITIGHAGVTAGIVEA